MSDKRITDEPQQERRAVGRVEGSAPVAGGAQTRSEQQATTRGKPETVSDTAPVPAVSDPMNGLILANPDNAKFILTPSANGATRPVSDPAELVKRLQDWIADDKTDIGDAGIDASWRKAVVDMHAAADLIENLWQLNIDACEEDTACRKLLAAYDTSDSYGVVPLEELIERLVRERDEYSNKITSDLMPRLEAAEHERDGAYPLFTARKDIPGCVCNPGTWGDKIWPICAKYQGNGHGYCQSCEHDKACHK